jgi:hypothetical protein
VALAIRVPGELEDGAAALLDPADNGTPPAELGGGPIGSFPPELPHAARQDARCKDGYQAAAGSSSGKAIGRGAAVLPARHPVRRKGGPTALAIARHEFLRNQRMLRWSTDKTTDGNGHVLPAAMPAPRARGRPSIRRRTISYFGI